MLTPLSDNFSIKFGSLGDYVENELPFEKTPFILFPWISTFKTSPFSTEVKNSENII